ncbi:hypothetical protein MAR_021303, partial [Mya arenaria]
CSSTGTVTSGVFGGVVGGVVALAAIVVAVLIISRRYQFPCVQTSDPVVKTQTASPYEHLATRAQTEYTAIVLAVPTMKPPLMSVFTPGKMPLIQSWELTLQRVRLKLRVNRQTRIQQAVIMKFQPTVS